MTKKHINTEKKIQKKNKKNKKSFFSWFLYTRILYIQTKDTYWKKNTSLDNTEKKLKQILESMEYRVSPPLSAFPKKKQSTKPSNTLANFQTTNTKSWLLLLLPSMFRLYASLAFIQA